MMAVILPVAVLLRTYYGAFESLVNHLGKWFVKAIFALVCLISPEDRKTFNSGRVAPGSNHPSQQFLFQQIVGSREARTAAFSHIRITCCFN